MQFGNFPELNDKFIWSPNGLEMASFARTSGLICLERAFNIFNFFRVGRINKRVFVSFS